MPIPSEIQTAAARAFIHRWLALAYTDPEPLLWQRLRDADRRATMRQALQSAAPSLLQSWTKLESALERASFEQYQSAYRAAFGHTVRGDCPPYEIEYGELKADPLYQPHRLADIAAFYKAFGMEIAPDAKERPDFIAVQFEFLAVLCAKQSYALQNPLLAEPLAICCDAQRDFLRDHLARWTPAFTRRIERLTRSDWLRALALFTREFILNECQRTGAPWGNEDLNLRAADVAAETMCDRCGMAAASFPGAVAMEKM